MERFLCRCNCGYLAATWVGLGSPPEYPIAFKEAANADRDDLEYSFPCLCYDCLAVCTANVWAHSIICPMCRGANLKPYTDETLHRDLSSEEIDDEVGGAQLGKALHIYSDSEPVLQRGRFLCPSCSEKELEISRDPFGPIID